MTHTVSHLGICVSDLAASLRFWCDGLGFAEVLGAARDMDSDGVVLRLEVQPVEQMGADEAHRIEELAGRTGGDEAAEGQGTKADRVRR